MDNETLRQVQLVQLEIAKEVKRVCEKNNIQFFLDSGSLLGAIRHKGFIPWDDDLDLGMLRSDYERFREVVNSDLDPQYCFVDWHSDSSYPLPFGKVLKKGTIYLEGKAKLTANSKIYIDIFPYDYSFDDDEGKKKLASFVRNRFRIILMKCGYKPWKNNGKVILKKRIGYLFYQFISIFVTKGRMIQEYENYVTSIQNTHTMYEQTGTCKVLRFRPEIFRGTEMVPFEDTLFPVMSGWDEWLKIEYGNYLLLPPEEKRKSRHQIVLVDCGKEKKEEVI